MSNRLFLVRHGMTQWNNEGRYQGHTDTILSSEGIKQAQALQKRFAGENIQAIYSSDLNRAYETARILAEPQKTSIQVEPGLREIHFGVWEGLQYQDLQRDYPEQLKVWLETPHQLSVPGGETFAQVRDRAVRAVKEILSVNPLGNIILVTHGGTIAALICGLLNQPLEMMWTYRQKNAAVNILLNTGEGFIMEKFNDISHLEE